VVAGEVRRLAHESNDSAGSIRKKLEKISAHSAKGAEAIAHVGELVRALAQCADSSSSTITRQSRLVEDLQIRCQSAWENSEATAKSMFTLSQAASSTRDSAQRTSQSACTLQDMASEMAARD
jgi:methyl-accepting chemotaxis protein